MTCTHVNYHKHNKTYRLNDTDGEYPQEWHTYNALCALYDVRRVTRNIAQIGRALALGVRGHRFKPYYSDCNTFITGLFWIRQALPVGLSTCRNDTTLRNHLT